MLDWFKSFICGRKQFVKVENSVSDTINLLIGVPQGSVLGPILFLVYINSLLKQSFDGSITVFADDAAFSYCGKNANENYIKMKNDIELIRKWFYTHKLTISQKTKSMVFSFSTNEELIDVEQIKTLIFHSAKCSNLSLNNNGSTSLLNCCDSQCFTIELVKEFKYLGLIIDMFLNWKAHINLLISYFHKAIRQLFELKKYCSVALLRVVYFALFNSKMQYGLKCWGGTNKTNVNPLLIAQNILLELF